MELRMKFSPVPDALGTVSTKSKGRRRVTYFRVAELTCAKRGYGQCTLRRCRRGNSICVRTFSLKTLVNKQGFPTEQRLFEDKPGRQISILDRLCL